MNHTPGPWHIEADRFRPTCFRIYPPADLPTGSRMPVADRVGKNDAALIAAAPALLAALRIGLHHTQRAADWTKDAHRRALEEGMHGNAANHHQAWQDTLEAVKVIEAAIAAAEGQA